MKVLVDTDILIDYLRGDVSVKEQLEHLWGSNCVYLSVLSVYELHAGSRPGEEEEIADLLAPIRVLPVDRQVAIAAGQRRNRYRHKGVTLGDMDCMIAATAELDEMQVYTRNVRHYPGIDLYKC
jgi:predicted nucleic acid-binding protein